MFVCLKLETSRRDQSSSAVTSVGKGEFVSGHSSSSPMSVIYGLAFSIQTWVFEMRPSLALEAHGVPMERLGRRQVLMCRSFRSGLDRS